MKPYSNYKNTGETWLNKIPEHWNVKRAKSVFKSIDIRSKDGSEELLSVSEKQGVALRKNTNVTMFQAANYAGYKLCWPQDLVINSLWAWMRGLGFSEYHGIISTAYSVFRIWNPEKFNYKYGNYLLRSKIYNWEFRVRSKGIWRSRYQLSDDSFLSMPLVLPSLSEQQQIAQYLDWKTTKINKFIKAKKKLIALLKEQKQNIFNKALTKGINPNIKMKDSGINWLGDIPIHWKAITLKNCISPIEQGWSPQCEAKRAEENQWGVLKVGCVNGEKFDVLQNKKLPDYLTPKLQYEIKQDDIIVSRANTRELVGLAAIVDKNYSKILLCDKLYRFTTKNHLIIKHFLVLSMRTTSSRIQIEVNATGASSSMQNISQGVIKNLYLPLPPISEQEQIIKFLDKETFVINKTIKRAEQEIELIQEYQTRLISDVVTGKVDVRSIQVPEFESIEKDIDFFDENNTEEEVMEDIEE